MVLRVGVDSWWDPWVWMGLVPGFTGGGMIGARSQWEVDPNIPMHACNCKLQLCAYLNEDLR